MEDGSVTAVKTESRETLAVTEETEGEKQPDAGKENTDMKKKSRRKRKADEAVRDFDFRRDIMLWAEERERKQRKIQMAVAAAVLIGVIICVVYDLRLFGIL